MKYVSSVGENLNFLWKKEKFSYWHRLRDENVFVWMCFEQLLHDVGILVNSSGYKILLDQDFSFLPPKVLQGSSQAA